MYAPSIGRFLSRDPMGFADGHNTYQAAMAINKVDPRGLSGVRPYTPPPATPFSGSTCKVAVRCGPAFHGLGTHCGLIVETDDGIFGVDGTGGSVNHIGWPPLSGIYGTTGPFTSMDPSYCECLRSQSIAWNALDVPRNSLGQNSNFTLGCLTKKCGIRLNFPGGEPMGFDLTCCLRYSEPSKMLTCPSYPPPPYCVSTGDCCKLHW